MPKFRWAAASALLFGTLAQAAPANLADPYGEAPAAALRFADLEFAMPTDPLLWSSDPGWKPHATPQHYLADAETRIRAAIPPGTDPAHAAAVLRKAGARCGKPDAAAMVCRYDDLEMPWGGDFHDNVTWTVRVALAKGAVSGIAVAREWTRR
ncbi:MAG: hypothetical protein JSS36_02495 [Proteobacteria bacterium]|nr:hypothetical protein [Pseudomonadota bacterium]